MHAHAPSERGAVCISVGLSVHRYFVACICECECPAVCPSVWQAHRVAAVVSIYVTHLGTVSEKAFALSAEKEIKSDLYELALFLCIVASTSNIRIAIARICWSRKARC